MNNKWINLAGGIIFIIGGIRIINLKVFEFRYYKALQLSEYSLIIGGGFIILGIYFISLVFIINYSKEEKYTICPNCKETFNYIELKNGKCKYCKDVDTIDTQKYYKEHPEELEV